MIQNAPPKEMAKRTEEYPKTNAGVIKNSEIRLTGQVFIQEILNLFIRDKHKAFMSFMLCGPCCHSKSNQFVDAVSHHS